jgi:predicted nucleic acid-binding protein
MNYQPGYIRRIFVDTSAYFALANRRDASHQSASDIMQQLVAERRRLFTTSFVLAELHALLLTRLNRTLAAHVLGEIDASKTTTIVRVSARDEQQARAIITRYTDKDFSLTDATSFAVMERLGISHAFTLDHNFAQYGWTMISPSMGT